MLPVSYVRIGVLFILALGIVGYVYYTIRDLAEGPRVVIEYPVNGSRVQDALLTIRGKAEHITRLTVNDRETVMDETGIFSEQLLVPNGYTIISVEGTDALGRVTTKTLYITR